MKTSSYSSHRQPTSLTFSLCASTASSSSGGPARGLIAAAEGTRAATAVVSALPVHTQTHTYSYMDTLHSSGCMFVYHVAPPCMPIQDVTQGVTQDYKDRNLEENT